VVFSQSQGQGWERGSGGVAEHCRIRGQEWDQAAHTPAGVTYVTEKHFFLVKGAVTHLTLCIIREGTGRGGGERVCGPGRG